MSFSLFFPGSLEKWIGTAAVLLLVTGLGGGAILADQPDPVPSRVESYVLDSGTHDNPHHEPLTVWSDTVTLKEDVYWMTLIFSNLDLPEGSFLRLTPVLRHKSDRQDPEAFAPIDYPARLIVDKAIQIGARQVRLELIAGPDTYGNRLRLERIVASVAGGGGALFDHEKAICPMADGRTPTTDAAVARLRITRHDGNFIGTAFMVDCGGSSQDKCFLSAGHNFNPRPISVNAEFDVPSSNANCVLVSTTNRNRFSVDLGTLKSQDDSSGDWAVFRVKRNAHSQRTAFQEQGKAYRIEKSSLPTSGNVRVTGYGRDNGSGCGICASPNGANNYVLQSHSAGIVQGAGAHRIGYVTDTCGGNSGSPVIWAGPNKIVGIHTNGGCTSRGFNFGTSILYPPLQAALRDCGSRKAIVLIDRTGSMNVTRASGKTRCADALAAARLDIQQFFRDNPAANGSRLAVWTFSGGSSSQRTGFVQEAEALAAVGALSPNGCSGSTPLAEAMCDAADVLAQPSGLSQNVLAVSTDGGENNSSGECAGFNSSLAAPPYSAGSWQNLVRAKMLRSNVVISRSWGNLTRSRQLEDSLEGVTSPPVRLVTDLDFFTELSETSGGSAIEVGDSDSTPLTSIFEEIFVDGFEDGAFSGWSSVQHFQQ